MDVSTIIEDVDELIKLGECLGEKLHGGEVIELIGDVGTGKTTLVKGIAKSLGVKEAISSPSFPILLSYVADNGVRLNHYDFYRLDDPGIMKSEISESLCDAKTITIVEWGDSVSGVLPDNRMTIRMQYLPSDTGREIIIDESLDKL